MRILFVIAHSGLARHLGRVIELAAQAGHEVVVTVCGEKKNLVVQTLQQLRVYNNIRQIKSVRVLHGWKLLLTATRALLDLGPYLRPGHPSPNLITRYRKVLPFGLFKLIRNPWFARLVASRWLHRLLRRLERNIPPSSTVCRVIEDIRPDVVMTTPYLFPNSADVDFLKAASYLGIPTCSAIASWDNLSTKGTGHVPVDRLFLWNQELKTEAESLHGVDPDAMTITGSPTFDHLFGWSPTLSRDDFCAWVGVAPDKKLLLYLCSSGSIADDEETVVRWLAEALAANPATGNCYLMVRPHPLNFKIWAAAASLPGNVRIFPERGDLPDNPESIDIYCHSIHFANAMIGLNTSAFLEACVLDRPCIALPAMAGCYDQKKFGHFKHLANGNFIHTPATLEAAADIVGEMLATGRDSKRAARQEFVRYFLRPRGLECEASAVMLDAIVETARAPSRQPGRRFFSSIPCGRRPYGERSVVYVLIGLAHFPYHESVISALCRAGFRVDLAILKLGTMASLAAEADETLVGELISSFKDFVSAHPNLHVLDIAKPELVVPEASKRLRFLRSLASYIRRLPKDNFYRRRWLGYMPEDLARFANRSLVRGLLALPVAESVLGWIDRHLLAPPPVVRARLRHLRPDMVFISPGDMRYSHEVEWLKAAVRLGIRTGIVTLSWDNLTTKGLVHVQPDHLFVWNASHADEARRIHHMSDEAVFLAGAPFFDKWRAHAHLLQDRAEFMISMGLDPARPYIVYLGSSANIADNEAWLVREIHQAIAGADDPELRNTQIYVRPHPGNRKICVDLADLPIVVSSDHDAGIPFSDDRKRCLYNTLHHSAVTVSINTSAIIDAIAIGKPCISVKTDRYGDTHIGSAHFRHLLDAGAVVMADSAADCARRIGEHLHGADPSRERRLDFMRRFIKGPMPGLGAGETIARIASELLYGKSAADIKRQYVLQVTESADSARR